MEACTFVDIVYKHTDPYEYLKGCPIKDETFQRNLVCTMKRMSQEDDIIMLHYGLQNVAAVYRSHVHVNPQIYNAILEAIMNMKSVMAKMGNGKKEVVILNHHINYIWKNILL